VQVAAGRPHSRLVHRQAGRYIRIPRGAQQHSLIEICKKPNRPEVTITAPKRSASIAIIFADLLLPLEVMGPAFPLRGRRSPVIEKPVREPKDITRCAPTRRRPAYVAEAIRIVCSFWR